MYKKEIHSPLVITRREPSIAKQYKYYAFGDLRYESGTYYDNHKFTGKEEDGSGLYYFGARYYDKSIGRWISPDPASMPSNLNLNDPQTLNPYVYCTNNPLKYIDPNGMWRVFAFANDGGIKGAYIYRQTLPVLGAEYFTRQIPYGDAFLYLYRQQTADITSTSSDFHFTLISSIISSFGAAGYVLGVVMAEAELIDNAIESKTDIRKMRMFANIMGIDPANKYNIKGVTTFEELEICPEITLMRLLDNLFDDITAFGGDVTAVQLEKYTKSEFGNLIEIYRELYGQKTN